MRNTLARSICTLVACTFASASWAATYFVDPNSGSDSYDGLALIPGASNAGPYKTIQKALNLAVSPGDTVYLRGGTYRQGNTAFARCIAQINGSGAMVDGVPKYLTIAAWAGERPVLKGSQVATGWQPYDLTGGKAIYATREWRPGEDFMYRYPQQAFVSTVEDYGAGKDGTPLKQLHWIDTAVSASTVFTLSANPGNNNQVTIAGKAYTFKTTLTVPAVEGEVKIGATVNDTLNNFSAAINGTQYAGIHSASVRNPKVSTDGVITSQSIKLSNHVDPGGNGNGVATTVNSGPNLSFTGSVLAGGVDGSTANTAAKSMLRASGNPSANDTVMIGSKTYTFKATLSASPTVEGEVLRGATREESIRNLRNAINHTGTPGTDYQCAAAHPTARGLNSLNDDTVIQVGSILNGRDGNGTALGKSSAMLAWDNATLVNGQNGAGVLASGTLTGDNTDVTNNETVTIGSKTYTFKTTLSTSPAVEGEVLQGGTANESLQNLIDAINHRDDPPGTIAGTKYTAAVAHPDVSAGALDPATHAFGVLARQSGQSYDSTVTTETSTHLAWGAATLVGGTRGGWEANGVPLQRYQGTSGSLATMTRGSFFYDNDTQVLYAWLPDDADPSTRVIEVASAPVTWCYFGSNGNYLHVKGLTFRHSNIESFNGFGAGLISVGNHSIMEDCDAQWGDFGGGGAAEDSLILNSKFNNNGAVGVTAGNRSTIRNCQINSNNYRNFNRDWHAGGSKSAKVNVLFEGCEVAFNNGFGIWTDVDCGYLGTWDGHEGFLVRDSYIHHNYLAGIFFEISQSCAAKNNVITNNTVAVMIRSSSNCTITNNTIAYNSPGPNPLHSLALVVDMWNDGRQAMVNTTFTHNLLLENRGGAQVRLMRNGEATMEGPSYVATGNVCDYNVYEHGDPTSIVYARLDQPNPTPYTMATLPFEWDATPRTWPEWQKTVGSANSGYDEHSIYGTAVDVNFATLGYTSTPGANLTAMQAKGYSAISNVFSPLSSPGLVGYLGSRPGFTALQNTVNTHTGSITTLQTGATTAATNISNLQTWQAEPTLGAGKDFIAGYSTGDPSTSNLKGGFRYNTDSGQTNGRNFLFSGDAFNWGEFALFASATASGSPTLPRFYHDAIANTTTIGHNAADKPTGTATFNVEGTISQVPSAAANGSPRKATYLLTGQTTNANRTAELTLPGGNRIAVPNNRTFLVTAYFVCREVSAGSGDKAGGFVRTEVAKNVGNTTTILNKTVDYNFTARDASSFTAKIEADDATDSLVISGVTNISDTMNWAVEVQVVEISE